MKEINYVGEDAGSVFIEHLMRLESELYDFLNRYKEMDWEKVSQEEKEYFDSPNAVCHICEKPFLYDDIRTRDHCHVFSDYLGPAHQGCNLNRNKYLRIPLFSHGGSNYDMHLFTKVLNAKHCDYLKITPKTSEKYSTIYMNNYIFLDSTQFLPSSLDDLVNTLKNSGGEFKILEKSNLFKTEKQKNLLLRKGVMCYDYMQSHIQLSNSTLPSHDEFFSVLKGEDISEEDYEHARNVYESFECKSMIDYLMIYNILDTYLLAECVMDFRNMAYTEFKLDPLQYVSLPSFSMDAFLYKSKEEIELMTDLNMILMIEAAIRGGMSFVSERYAKETKEMSLREFDRLSEAEKLKTCKILYIDRNSLYGESQCLPVPCADYRWLTRDEIKGIDWRKTDASTNTGFILECDLRYEKTTNFIPLSL